MPLMFWLLTGSLVGTEYRTIRGLREAGQEARARAAYRRTGLVMGLMVYAMMGLQIFLAASIGAAGIDTVLPLHLCSMVGVLTLPMLMRTDGGLWEFCLYLGAPGALMALIFPAMLETPWPGAMAIGFLGLHALIFWAPFLPMALGKRPRPQGVWRVFFWGNLFLAFVAVFNIIFDTNYLFLRMPPKGTPLDYFFQKGPVWYVAFLEGAAVLLLSLEGRLAGWGPRIMAKKRAKGI